jgi:hypothetical protein
MEPYELDEHGHVAGTPFAPEEADRVVQRMKERQATEKGEGGGIRFVQLNPHGRTTSNPYSLTPDGDHCMQCGKRPPGDEGDVWQAFEDIPRGGKGVLLTEAVVRRSLKYATPDELRRHPERAEANGDDKIAGWIRKVISERT